MRAPFVFSQAVAPRYWTILRMGFFSAWTALGLLLEGIGVAVLVIPGISALVPKGLPYWFIAVGLLLFLFVAVPLAAARFCKDNVDEFNRRQNEWRAHQTEMQRELNRLNNTHLEKFVAAIAVAETILNQNALREDQVFDQICDQVTAAFFVFRPYASERMLSELQPVFDELRSYTTMSFDLNNNSITCLDWRIKKQWKGPAVNATTIIGHYLTRMQEQARAID